MRSMLPLALLALLAAGPTPARGAEPDLTPAASRKPAPALELADLKGTKRNLAELKGKVVVLNFWASWCMPCRREMPTLVKLQESLGSAGVQVVGAAAEDENAREDVESFATKSGVNFPVWMAATPQQMGKFGLPPALPGTVLIDREGRLAGRIEGIVEASVLRASVDALLAEKKPAH